MSFVCLHVYLRSDNKDYELAVLKLFVYLIDEHYYYLVWSDLLNFCDTDCDFRLVLSSFRKEFFPFRMSLFCSLYNHYHKNACLSVSIIFRKRQKIGPGQIWMVNRVVVLNIDFSQ